MERRSHYELIKRERVAFGRGVKFLGFISLSWVSYSFMGEKKPQFLSPGLDTLLFCFVLFF
jgi:hypothetical protein